MTARARRQGLIRTLSLALVAGLATLLCAADASAQVSRHHARHARHTQRAAVARKLGLTEAQREQMRAAAVGHRQSIDATRDALRTADRALRDALHAQPRDPAAIDAARAAVKQAHEASSSARDARRADVGAALTPDQRQQLQAAKEAHQARRTSKSWR